MWTSFHHMCSGSNKYNLLLQPRDAYFDIEVEEEERLRAQYAAHIDGTTSSGYTDRVDGHPLHGNHGEYDLNPPDWARPFEWLPVQNQIYDVLVYAHRTHLSSSSMLFEIRKLGLATITWPMAEIFVRLCPLCSLRVKGSSHGVKRNAASSSSFDTNGTKR